MPPSTPNHEGVQNNIFVALCCVASNANYTGDNIMTLSLYRRIVVNVLISLLGGCRQCAWVYIMTYNLSKTLNIYEIITNSSGYKLMIQTIHKMTKAI